MGFETEIICNKAAPYQQALHEAGVRVTHMNVKHRLDFISAALVRQRIKEGRVNVIYAPRNSTLAVSLMAAKGLDVRVAGYRGTTGHLNRWDPASWFTYLNPRVSRIICVSNAVRNYLLSFGLPESRLVTIYKGHNPEWYEAEQPSLDDLGIPPDAFVVGFTGNIRPVKGIDILIQAVSHIPRDRNVHFLLVGEVRDRRVKALSRDPELNKVLHFTGFRKDATALMRACQAYVMPSIEREGLPRGVVEAMCQSIPPIVTNVGGMPELVEDAVSGLVVPPRKPGALAVAILSLKHDEEFRASLGTAARSRIENHFHIDQTITQMSDLFRELAEE